MFLVQPFVLNFHAPFTYLRISRVMPWTTLIGQPCFSDSIHLGAVLCHAYPWQNGCCLDGIEKIDSSAKTESLNIDNILVILLGDSIIKI
jgi:hypothetical protein